MELQHQICDPQFIKYVDVCKKTGRCQGEKGFFEQAVDGPTGEICGEDLISCGCPRNE